MNKVYLFKLWNNYGWKASWTVDADEVRENGFTHYFCEYIANHPEIQKVKKPLQYDAILIYEKESDSYIDEFLSESLNGEEKGGEWP